MEHRNQNELGLAEVMHLAEGVGERLIQKWLAPAAETTGANRLSLNADGRSSGEITGAEAQPRLAEPVERLEPESLRPAEERSLEAPVLVMAAEFADSVWDRLAERAAHLDRHQGHLVGDARTGRIDRG